MTDATDWPLVDSTVEGAGKLNELANAIREAGERRRREDQAWRDNLPEPMFFNPSEDDPKFGVGIWNLSRHGVMTAYRYANGYSRNTVQYYTKDFIEKLARAAGLL